ncbi:MAG: 1-acyl-sn-glycerol-3-phosphate acyltransferase, partial [Actinobacteria bacterium]
MWRRATYLFLYNYFRLFHRLKIYGKENIPKKAAFIMVSNHMSYYDPPLIWATSYPRIVNFMAKEQLFKVPGFGLLIRLHFKAFPVK